MSLKSHLLQFRALENFQIRGDGSSRLEALSDGVFALAIAILLLSSSVPKNFNELWLFVQDIVPFGICMLFIYWIWSQQVIFFMRYGLLDTTTSALNLMLLFFVLFYVYPLKFLMSWLVKYFTAIFTGNFSNVLHEFAAMIPFEKIPLLMIIYGVGFVSIFVVMYFLYRHALKNKQELGLTALEEYETRYSTNEKLTLVVIGIFSIVLAGSSIVTRHPIGAILAGWVYNLIWMVNIFQRKKRDKTIAALAAAEGSGDDHPA